jgi:hypothetical protein
MARGPENRPYGNSRRPPIDSEGSHVARLALSGRPYPFARRAPPSSAAALKKSGCSQKVARFPAAQGAARRAPPTRLLSKGGAISGSAGCPWRGWPRSRRRLPAVRSRRGLPFRDAAKIRRAGVNVLPESRGAPEVHRALCEVRFAGCPCDLWAGNRRTTSHGPATVLRSPRNPAKHVQNAASWATASPAERR